MPTSPPEQESAFFMSRNFWFVVTVMSLLVGLAGKVYEKVFEKKRLAMVLGFLFIPALIGIATLIVGEIQNRNSARLRKQVEDQRQKTIKEIKEGVKESVATSFKTLKTSLDTLETSYKSLQENRKQTSALEEIKSRISGLSVDRVAVSLVRFSDEKTLLAPQEKPNVTLLEHYVDWLESNKENNPVMSLILNAEKNYWPGLVVGFLTVTKENQPLVRNALLNRQVLQDRYKEKWLRFPSLPQELENIKIAETMVKYVLFFNEREDQLVGYAEASAFASELILYNLQGEGEVIKNLLNKKEGADTVRGMNNMFPSFREDVLKSDNVESAVEEMINNGISKAIIYLNPNYWLFDLAEMVRVVK